VSRLPCVLAVAACLAAGTAPHGAGAGAAATPRQCAAPGKLDRAGARKFVSNCLLCALVGVKGISSTYHLPATKPNVLARALATKTASPELRKAVQAGCMLGFKLAAAKARSQRPARTTPASQAGQSSRAVHHAPAGQDAK